MPELLPILEERLHALARVLDEPAMEPDPSRDIDRERVARVVEEGLAVLDLTERAAAEVDEGNARSLRIGSSAWVGDAAGLAHAAGCAEGARRLLDALVAIAPRKKEARLFAAALRDPDGLVVLCRANWLQRKDRLDDADALVAQAAPSIRDPEMRSFVMSF